MDSFIAVTVIILNLALWAVFFANMGRRFNIKKFTDETRAELEKTITEMNGIVARNISIIDDKIAALNRLSSERIAEMKELSAAIDRKILLQKQESERAAAVQVAGQKVADAMDSYRSAGIQFVRAQPARGQEVSVQKVPVYEPPVAEEKKAPAKDFAAQVKELYRTGLSLESIASKLSRTVSEVQFVRDMNDL